jgi:hypothetical protein
MQLSRFMEMLSLGTLSQVNIGFNASDGITENNYPTVIAAINLGLLDLYGRFAIKTEEVVIRQYDHITHYDLHTKYALSNTDSAEVYKYILDFTEKPFKDKILKIDAVYDGNGKCYPLNDSKQCDSLYTPYPTILQVPCPESPNTLHLMCRVAHDDLIVDCDLDQRLYIPMGLINCLITYVKSKILEARPTMEARNESMMLMVQYEQLCAQAEGFGLVVSDQTSNTKLRDKGWV